MKNELLFISIFVVLCISIGSASAVDIGNGADGVGSGITNEINVVNVVDVNVADVDEDVKEDDNLIEEDKESSANVSKSDNVANVTPKQVEEVSIVSASSVSPKIDTKTISSVSASTVTTAQILSSAVNLKNYVLNHHGLPKTVKVNGKEYGTEEFLYLMTLVLKDINAGKTSKSYSIKSVPDHGKDLNGDWVLSLKLTKTQYLDVAKRVSNYIVNNGKVPNYATLINGKKGDYKLYTYEFSCILSSYNSNKVLPSSCTFDCKIFETYSISDKLLSRVNNDLTFYLTTDNIVSSKDKSALDTLKSTLTSLGYKVKVVGVGPNYHNVAYQYGCTGSNSVLLCCFGGVDVCPIEEWVGKNPKLGDWFPTNYKGANILSVFYLDPYGCAANLNDYVGVAWDKKSGYYGEPLDNPAKYMSDNGISYIQTGTVNEVTKILKSIFKKSGPTPTSKSVTISNIISASASLKSYVDKNHVLPSSITVGSYKVNSAQFSYLMAAAIKQIKAGKSVSTKIKIISVKVPSYSTYSISYTAKSSAYVDMASRVANYCSSKGVAPKYVTISSKKADFRCYAYAFAKVLNYYKSYKKLPSTVSIVSSVYKKTVTTKSVSISNIISASASLKSYVLKNHVLPSSITVGSYKVNSAQFSYLMAAAIKQIKAGKSVSTKIKIISVKVPSYSTYSISYTAKSSAYVDMASRVANYCSSKGVAPKYATISSKKADFRSYAYAFAKVLSYYKSNKKLPSSVLIESKVFKK